MNLLGIILICASSYLQPSIEGQWNTVDEETGEVKAIVEFSERDGLFYGRIRKIFNKEHPDPVCEECDEDDDRHMKKIIGMEIVRGLKYDGEVYGGGTILDPQNGRNYRCSIWIEGGNLMVRGYWGPFYRTQIWRKSS